MRDWQIGDLALCIKQGPWEIIEGPSTPSGDDPEPGCIYCVANVELAELAGLVLGFAEFHSQYQAGRFVKVTPPEADEFDREVIELLNRHPAEAILTQDGEG